MRLVRRLRGESGTEHVTVKRVAGQLGYGVESVREWVHERDVTDGVAGPEAQRIRGVEAKNTGLTQPNRELVRAYDVLKKASAIFAQAEAGCADEHPGSGR